MRETARADEKSTMWVCALETSSSAGEVALMDPEGECRTLACPGELSQGKDLFPVLAQLMDSCGLRPRDLGLLAVDYGPGSYTGIRVGVTAAKVLAFSLGAPLVAVNALEAIARNLAAGRPPCAAPVLDAKLGQVYAAVFRTGPLAPVLLDFVGTVEELVPRLPAEAVVFGDGADRYRARLGGFAEGPAEWARPRAAVVARMGKDAYATRGAADPDSLTPLYLRISHAEQKLRERASDAR